MVDLLFIPIAIVYLAVVGLLFLYGLNFFYLTYLAWQNRRRPTSPPAPDRWPRVTVQLPIYNEMYVAERLLRAVSALDYPADLLEIQVLDDSTDETSEIIRTVVEEIRGQGLEIAHLRRKRREGFKAGALAEGLARAGGEFLAVFDADFIPKPDFLKRSLPYFQNPRLAFIQTRWGHVNQDYSILTRLQSLSIDAHFMVEQFARSQGGYMFNFNGTAGIWRKAAILAVGGWKADTLTEDLDLSYRAFLGGWEAAYVRQVEVPAELPVSFTAYRRQQHRWARGSFECALKLIPQILNHPASPGVKAEAILHLTGYGVHLLLFALVLLYPIVLLISQRYANFISLFGIAAFFNATAFAPTLFFVVAQHQLQRRWWQALPSILFLTVLGAGMMLNTVRAALQVRRKKAPEFERTPKFGIARREENLLHRRYQLSLDPLVFAEIALALFNLGTAAYALSLGNWVIAIYASLFGLGLLFTSSFTIGQAIALHRNRKHTS